MAHTSSFFGVGPTVRIASVHRFAASSLPSGPPTLRICTFLIAGLFTKRTIQQLFRKLDAFVLHDPGIPLDATIQRHADFPGARECPRILNRRFVHESVRAARRVTFDDM